VLLVVFGAGASYDSVPHLRPCQPPVAANQNNWSPLNPPPLPGEHENDRPPLANRLFDNRDFFVVAMEQFGACRALIPYLRNPTVSVESELAKFQEEAMSYPERDSQLAAVQYYLHTALWKCEDRWRPWHHGITNYVTFLDEIERWRRESREQVCFVTFNYDRMLDDAMTQVLRIQFLNLNDYISSANYALIKLHGSVNWGREIRDGPAALATAPHTYRHDRLIAEVQQLQISDQYRLVNNCPMLRVDNCFVFPAIAIPVEHKDSFVCPSTHVDRLTRMIPSVDRIITVGWRAMESDFLNLLTSGLPQRCVPTMIVSGSPEGTKQTQVSLSRIVEQIAHLQGLLPPTLIDTGFSGLILQERDKLNHFLRLHIQ
jgi:hypothetical protein